MGLTFNCCRCHDHKFDPIAQREYYQLFAFFNQTPVTGGGRDPQTKPVIEMPDPSDEKHKRVARVMVMEDQPKQRETFILTKGLYNQPAAKVEFGTPAALPPMPAEFPRNRLGLAKWLTSPRHPLMARVTVNRLWQQFFGVGLVKTVGDFGIQGERPVHPELLDWLAVEFVESGWNVKHLVRLIVTSATYRQSSRVTPELHERDPDNRLLARGSRYRLPSWLLRDQALAASGLLVPIAGGPPVRPYQPAGIWEEATFGTKKYVQDHGDALYRRSVYTFWRRIVGPTLFFDVAGRAVCTVKQSRTNTPLHALTTLNDVTYVEAARVLAERVLTSAMTDDSARLDVLYQRVLGRKPTPAERPILLSALDRLRQDYADADAAKKLLAVGESKRNEKLNPTEHAAWTALGLLVLNLDETLSRE